MKVYTDTKTYTNSSNGDLLYEGKYAIPKDPSNTLYQEYLDRVDQGKAITNEYTAPSYSWKVSRIREYPSLDECVHALLDGGQSLTDLQAARAAVKLKYPKE